MCLLRQEGKEDGILGKSILRMIIDLPKNVEKIIERLEENGFERVMPREKWELKKGGKYYVKKSMKSHKNNKMFLPQLP